MVCVESILSVFAADEVMSLVTFSTRAAMEASMVGESFCGFVCEDDMEERESGLGGMIEKEGMKAPNGKGQSEEANLPRNLEKKTSNLGQFSVCSFHQKDYKFKDSIC